MGAKTEWEGAMGLTIEGLEKALTWKSTYDKRRQTLKCVQFRNRTKAEDATNGKIERSSNTGYIAR